jgi:hypothetical protein
MIKNIKPCNEKQIRNPKSLRCVNKDGRLGKLIIALLNLKDYNPDNLNKINIPKSSLNQNVKVSQLQNLIEKIKKTSNLPLKLSPNSKKNIIKSFKPTLQKISEEKKFNSNQQKNIAAKIIQRNFKKFIYPFINRVSPHIYHRIQYYKNLMNSININYGRNKHCIRLIKIDPNTNEPIFKINNSSIILKNKIGNDNINGIVYLCSIKDDYKKLYKFAAKILLYNDKSNSEIAVFNKLSNATITKKCPHFPILYSTLKCDRFSDFDTFKNEDLIHYPRIVRLNPNGSFNIILSELANGNLKMFINDNSIIGNDYQINALVQILLSIMFFYKETKSYHNDASSGNFLFHKIKPGGYFHYKILDKDYYLENIGFLWVIWDFSETISFNDSKFKNIKINNDFNNIINSFISPIINTKINTFTKTAIAQLTSIIRYSNLVYSKDAMIRLISNIMNCLKTNNFIKTTISNISNISKISNKIIINKSSYIIRQIDI